MTDAIATKGSTRRVHCRAEGAVGWLHLDNQERLNAMSLSMWRELEDGAAKLDADPDVRVIVVAGQGEKAFCAGGDVSEFGELRHGEKAMQDKAMQEYDAVAKVAMLKLERASKPTIAMIRGYCMGSGVAIGLSCDLRIAGEDARMGIPSAKLGLSYDFFSIKRLVDLVGPSHAKHILYTGDNFRADAALRQGLVNEVLPSGELETYVRGLAGTIAANAPLSHRATKLIVDMTLKDPAERDMAACQAAELACLCSEDLAQATQAFMEKRKPTFHGR